MSEIKPVFYVDATTLRCRTMDDISDESVLYYRRGDKVHEADVALYPESAIEALQKENQDLRYLNLSSMTDLQFKNRDLEAENAAQAKRIAELEAATEHLGLTPQQAADGLARHKAQVAEIEAQAKRIEDIKAAINEYYSALDTRQHGGVAQNNAFYKVQNVLGMQWIQGASLSASKNGDSK